MIGIKKSIVLVGISAAVALTAHGEYTLKINKGKYPEDVKIENINGNIPLAIGYKNGWTDQGWTAGDYSNKKNVALSPSYLATGEVCESALTLPPTIIKSGEWLTWEGCAVYPVRSEQYTVEIKTKDSDKWTVIKDSEEENTTWSYNMIDLSEYADEECEIRFVCRSKKGYMLALNNIKISIPLLPAFECHNPTPKFFAKEELEDGIAYIEIPVKNTGRCIASAKLSISANGSTVAEIDCQPNWETGESRSFSLPLPLTLNTRTDYTISILVEDSDIQILSESYVYLTSMKRHLLVDEGTGMWCNSCPTGALDIEKLEEEYGESLITVETHNNDPLANDTYFNWLGYHSIPRMELNRITTTSGEDPKNFTSQICLPTEMAINITDIKINSDNTLNVSADVRTSDDFCNPDKTYRIGYVLTKDIDGSEDIYFYQNNICALPKFKQYYYLPSRIPADLCFFHATSLQSPLASTSDDVAFTGINGSLPQSLTSGQSYTYSWDIPLPVGYTEFRGIRLVAFILESGKRSIENSTAVSIDEMASIIPVSDKGTWMKSKGIFSIDGRKIIGKASDLQPGVYIIDGEKRVVK